METGWYTPLTEEGTVVVNGVVASCHTGPSHYAARLFYQPIHLYLTYFPRAAGQVPSALQNEQWYSILFKREMWLGRFLFDIVAKSV
jgi:hypothetical protein